MGRLCLETIGLIVAPWKFDVLENKTSIFANTCFKNIKLPQGNDQPIVPRERHFRLNRNLELLI